MSLRTHKLLLFLGLLAYWGIFRGEWILKAYPAPTANTPEQLILDAFIVLLGVGASAMPKLPREIMRSYRLLPAFVAFVSSVASFVLTRIPEQPVATTVAPPFSAMACILLTTGWCVAYTRLRAHKVTESLPTLAVLSYIAMHVLVIPASVLGVDAVILPFVPLVSSILLAFALAPVVQTTDRGPDAPAAAAGTPSDEARGWRPVPMRQTAHLISIVAIVVVSAFLAGIYTAESSHYANMALTRAVQTAAIGLAVAGVVHFANRVPSLHALLWPGVLVVFSLACFIAVSAGESKVDLASDVITAGRRVVYVMLLVYICEAAIDDGTDVVRTAPLYLGAGFGLARAVIDTTRMLTRQASIIDPAVVTVTVAIGMILLGAAFAILGYGLAGSMPQVGAGSARTRGVVAGSLSAKRPDESDSDDLRGHFPGDEAATGGAGAPLNEICKGLAQTYDLTGRETETLALLAQGYTNQRIASELYVSINTVKSHIQSIYRKTDRHSKQEIIDLVKGSSPS